MNVKNIIEVDISNYILLYLLLKLIYIYQYKINMVHHI